MTPDRPISELFAQGRPLRSLEFFPPRDDAGVEALKQTATVLKRIAPDFVSVTYGAGGSTRERTAQICDFLKRDYGFTVMPHLTCVGHSRAELSEVAADPHDAAVEELVELFRAVQGEHPDWDEYRAAMVADRRLVLRLPVDRVYGAEQRS